MGTKVLVLTESIMNLVIQNKSDNIRRLLIFGITDICVGFLNRNNIIDCFENQGFEHLNESESDCDSDILAGFENLNSDTTTPIQVRSPIHDIISLESCEEVSNLTGTVERDIEPDETNFMSANTI